MTDDELQILEARWRVGEITETDRAHAIDVRTDYQYDELAKWRDLYEELAYLDRLGKGYLGRKREAVEADVLVLARSILE